MSCSWLTTETQRPILKPFFVKTLQGYIFRFSIIFSQTPKNAPGWGKNERGKKGTKRGKKGKGEEKWGKKEKKGKGEEKRGGKHFFPQPIISIK